MQEYFVNRRQITLVIYLLMKGDIFFKESGGLVIRGYSHTFVI